MSVIKNVGKKRRPGKIHPQPNLETTMCTENDSPFLVFETCSDDDDMLYNEKFDMMGMPSCIN